MTVCSGPPAFTALRTSTHDPWRMRRRGSPTSPDAAMAPTRRLQPRFFQPRCPNQSDFNRGVLHHGVSTTVSQTRCLTHGFFSRGVLHHGFLHHGVFIRGVFIRGVFIRGVFKHGAVIPALVIPAPLAFPSTARLAGWQDRLAEPSHGIGFRLPPNRCHLDAAPIPPGAIEIMAFNWLHDSRPFNPGRHGRSRAQRAGMALGNGSRKWLPGTAPGNSSVSRATQSTSRRSASPSFVSPRSMPPRSILPCSKPPCSTSPPLLAVSGVIGPNVPASSNSPESFPATPWPSVRPVPPSPRRHVAERRGSPRLREDRPGRDFDTA